MSLCFVPHPPRPDKDEGEVQGQSPCPAVLAKFHDELNEGVGADDQPEEG